MHELLDAPGFISFVGVTVGRRMYTISAWETPEAARGIRSNAGHREAVARMFGTDTARVGGQTGIWAPWRLNEPIVRCTRVRQDGPRGRHLRVRRGAARSRGLLIRRALAARPSLERHRLDGKRTAKPLKSRDEPDAKVWRARLR